MKSLLIFCSLFIVLGFQSQAQDASRVDAWLNDLKFAPHDSARAHILWQVSFNISHDDPSKGIDYGYQSLAISTKLNDLKLQGDAHNAIGHCFDNKGEEDSARYHYLKSIELISNSGDICATAGVYANIGSLEKKYGNPTKALSFFLKAKEIQAHCPDLGYHASTLYSIGTVYNTLGNFDEALTYFNQSLQLEQKSNNLSKQAIIFNSTANALLGKEDYSQAAMYYHKAMALQWQLGNTYDLAYTSEGISELFERTGQLDSAIYYSSRAMRIFEEMQADFDVVYESTLLGRYYVKSNRMQEADAVLTPALKMARELNAYPELSKILNSLSQVKRAQGNYQLALSFLEESRSIHDNLNDLDTKEQLAELAGKYETSQRDQIILQEREEIQLQRQQKYTWALISACLLLVSVVFVFLFINKRRKAALNARRAELEERAKKEAEASEKAKLVFLANMAHEVRTPMNAIIGMSRVLTKELHEKRTNEYAKAIFESSEHLLVVLNDVIELTRTDNATTKPIWKSTHLQSAVQHWNVMYEHQVKERGLDWQLLTDVDQSLWLKMDPSRIQQIIHNLMHNALKFTERGGIRLEVKYADGELVLAVSDTGKGIAEKDIERIFHRYEQARQDDSMLQGGSGLGLAISKWWAVKMGGDIHVWSKPGEGSRFEVRIPAEMALPTEVDEAVQPNMTALHVIVAEDNDFNYRVVEDSLLAWFPEASVYRANTGNDVLKLLSDDEYDLIIMDVQMPLMDGYQATQAIREKNLSIPIMGLTASVMTMDLEKGIASGMNDIMQKPYNELEFVQRIQRLGFAPQAQERSDRLQTDWSVVKDETIEDWLAAIHSNDVDTLKRCAHRIRPTLISCGKDSWERECHEIEMSDDSVDIWNKAKRLYSKMLDASEGGTLS